MQRALDIELRKHPHKRDFQNCSGIPIAINIDQIAVFSPYGIKFLQLKNGMKFIGGSWARVDFDVPLTLDQVDIGWMFKDIEFPEEAGGKELIQALLSAPIPDKK